MPGVGGANPVTQSCFAMEIQELARPLLGNKDEPREGAKGKG